MCTTPLTHQEVRTPSNFSSGTRYHSVTLPRDSDTEARQVGRTQPAVHTGHDREDGSGIQLVQVDNSHSSSTLDWSPSEAPAMEELQNLITDTSRSPDVKLSKYGGIAGLINQLGTDLRFGLSAEEYSTDSATRAARIEKYGTNEYPKPARKHFGHFVWELLQDPMLILLIISAVVSVPLGIASSPKDGWYEGLAILIAVILVTGIGAFNNYSQYLRFIGMDCWQDRVAKAS